MPIGEVDAEFPTKQPCNHVQHMLNPARWFPTTACLPINTQGMQQAPCRSSYNRLTRCSQACVLSYRSLPALGYAYTQQTTHLRQAQACIQPHQSKQPTTQCGIVFTTKRKLPMNSSLPTRWQQPACSLMLHKRPTWAWVLHACQLAIKVCLC